MPLPTPAQAAQARANQGFLGRLGHTALTKTPYIGPAYNIGSTIAHLINGTTGQYGPPTSLVGKLLASLGGNPNNWPRAIAVNPGEGTAPTPYQLPGMPTNAETNNPPMHGQPGAVLPPSALPGVGTNNSGWNAWRSPGSQTFQQAMNPGSAIGPFGGGRVNPYDSNSTHGTPNSIDTSIPAWAAAAMAEVRKRHQI